MIAPSWNPLRATAPRSKFSSLLRPRLSMALAVLGASASPIGLAGAAEPSATANWEKDIRPLFTQYCYDCHGGKKTKGGVNLKTLDADPKVGTEFELWKKVKDSMHGAEMPPEDDPQPKPEEKALLMAWLNHSLEAAALANAGDPGVVTIRRLTNAEYDNTIRDLTGQDYRLAKEFLPDGGGGEGFSNVGDVLFVSPQQLDKYLAAARQLADHASILPGRGISFQSQRVGLRGPEQIRDQAEQSLYVWYQKMAAPYLPKDGDDMREGDYMLACWKFKYREQTGATTLEALAKEAGLFPAFLENWWTMLNNDKSNSRFLDITRNAWKDLPGPDAAKPQEVPSVVREKILAIQAERRSWWDPKRPGTGVQRMQQDADGLRPYGFVRDVTGHREVKLVAGDLGDGNRGDWVHFTELMVTRGKKTEPYLVWLRRQMDVDRKALQNPGADAAALNQRIATGEKVLAQFGKNPLGPAVNADTLVVQAPLVIPLPLPEDATLFRGKGRLVLEGPDSDFATMQWTAVVGNAPDPQKILPGVLTLWKRQTEAARNTMVDFSRMKTAFPDEYLRRMEEVSRNFQRGGKGPGVYYLSDVQLASLISPQEKDRMTRMLTDWRLVRSLKPNPKDLNEWDENLKGHLLHFAKKAWRRPLTDGDKQQITQLYGDARARDLDRESAAREVLVRIFISPDFVFKLEEANEPGEHPVKPWELATRLSYFLWSSVPDARLTQTAVDGSLLKKETLAAEVQRLLRDPRARALADEFAGQWLSFNGFSKHSTVDGGKFPEFTPELRADLYRETSEFFAYLIREDRPVKEIILADYTFLNERLAKHYGVPNVTGSEFKKVAVGPYQRGGILGMGSILTKTSYPQRTSPVLRGDWLLHAVLGAPTPPPPPDVPQLDDSAAKATTLRQRLEAHRADKACASCHDKIDPLGFALEGYDAIGRLRTQDDGGQPIDDSAQVKGGAAFKGLTGLREYLSSREDEFNAVFCRKLVGYALGRNVLPSDKPLLASMQEEMKKSGGRFSAAVLTLVQSRQFQHRRNE
jgi:hypothetical protein